MRALVTLPSGAVNVMVAVAGTAQQLILHLVMSNQCSNNELGPDRGLFQNASSYD